MKDFAGLMEIELPAGEIINTPGLFHRKKVNQMQTNKSYIIETNDFDAIRVEFADKASFDCYGFYRDIVAEDMSIEDILGIIKDFSNDRGTVIEFSSIQSGMHYLTIFISKNDVRTKVLENLSAIISVYISNGKIFTSKDVLRGYVTCYGEKDYVSNFSAVVKEKIGKKKIPSVKWHYLSDGSHSYTEMTIKSDLKVYDEYYPFIKGGVEKLIDDYMSSSSSILIMLGPPGTGKSTLLRHMIVSRCLTASLTYEERLLQQDKLFVQHLSPDSRSDVLILEDSDILLESRETAGNHVMNKLLNVSDGVIKVLNKKFIFTANLPSVKNIDPALLREGRCFKVIEFRNLSLAEARIAAEKAQVEVPEVEGEYSLAKIFQGTNVSQTTNFIKKRRVGF